MIVMNVIDAVIHVDTFCNSHEYMVRLIRTFELGREFNFECFHRSELLKFLEGADVCTAAELAFRIREVPYDLSELPLAPQPGDHSPGLWREASDGSDGAAEGGAVANAVAFFKDAFGHGQGCR